MVRKTITYLDYEGVEHTKDFYFNLSQTEFALLNNKIPGGIEAYIERIRQNHKEQELLELLVMFIVDSYGERSADGVDLIKDDPQGRKLGKRFIASEACDNLITELLEKEDNILNFCVELMPESVKVKVRQKMKETLNSPASVVSGENVPVQILPKA